MSNLFSVSQAAPDTTSLPVHDLHAGYSHDSANADRLADRERCDKASRTSNRVEIASHSICANVVMR